MAVNAILPYQHGSLELHSAGLSKPLLLGYNIMFASFLQFVVLVLLTIRNCNLFPCRPAEVLSVNTQIGWKGGGFSGSVSRGTEGSLINAFLKLLEGSNFLGALRYYSK